MYELKHYITVFSNKENKVVERVRFKQLDKHATDDVYDFVFNILKRYIKNDSENSKAIKVLINIGYINVNEFTIEYSYFRKLKSMKRFIFKGNN